MQKSGFVGVDVFYWKYVLLTLNHSLMTCGGPDVFTFATIFKKCDKTSSGGQECHNFLFDQ